ncbi:MAG: AAA family ATPase [Solirubrobacteraceae bacterium]
MPPPIIQTHSDTDMTSTDGAEQVGRLHQVEIRNYKSIGQATVKLAPLTIFVGPNGAGKSNFMDALAFVSECLVDSVELAFKGRGGISAVRRRSGGHPTNIGVRLRMDLAEHRLADYSFEIAAQKGERFSIAHERCHVHDFLGEEHAFEVEHGEFVKEIPGIRSQVTPDRLVLFAASATPEFRPVYDFLARMRFYSIVPSKLRDLQTPDPGDLLKPDGSNAAAVLKRIQDGDQERYRRICSLLSAAVAGMQSAEHRAIGQFETIKFRQDIGQKFPWTFDALNVSDGTLRLLGLLIAVYQLGPASVLGIEEPEATVHPAVAEQILEVLMDASRLRQILITTHSPDLLDVNEVDDEQVRVVTNPNNATVIAPLAQSSRAAIREHLYTTGELLRAGELEGDVEAAGTLASELNLFGPPMTSATREQ